MMSKGSLSSAHVCGMKPYSTGKTTDEWSTRSSTKTSHCLWYSYLSLDPLTTSTIMLTCSGGLSPEGMSRQRFMWYPVVIPTTLK